MSTLCVLNVVEIKFGYVGVCVLGIILVLRAITLLVLMCVCVSVCVCVFVGILSPSRWLGNKQATCTLMCPCVSQAGA